MGTPLVVTTDPSLSDSVLRLAAAAGVGTEVCEGVAQALARWSAASVVLVGADLAPALAALRPPRRDAVHVLVRDTAPPSDLFGLALTLGAESVAELPRSEAWLVELLTDAGDHAPARGLTVGIVGGSGGAGATTFACALGQVASRSGHALVLDLDPHGPGLDRVLGLDLQEGIRWDALQQTTGRLSSRSLHDAVPRRAGLGVLTWAPGQVGSLQAFAAREAMSAARRGHDVVVVDLPRAADPVVDELVSRCDLLVVVTVPTITGVSSAARQVRRMRRLGPARLLVRGDGLPVGEIERATGVPGALWMRDQRRLAESIDLGLGPVRSSRGPLALAAAEVLDLLATPGLAA
ncbi:septum site-determining protein Ssd [Nocardioides bigeumensis]|uniref:Septum site determining protein n=1 Tax=Nocardioides bigeumensis TaxID=433657 RepID=A0ABP5KGP3_9ACTN